MSETDPAATHRMEQMLAAMFSIGAAFGQLYKGLLEEDTPPSVAVKIVASYARGMAVTQWAAAREVNLDLDDDE